MNPVNHFFLSLFLKINAEQGTKFAPLKYEAKKDETVYVCGCKQTDKPPRCDGAHAKLP